MLTVADLRPIDLFEDLSDEELQRWVDAGVERRLEPGAVIERQDESTSGLHLVLSGVVQALITENGRSEPMGRHVAPTWLGAIPVLTEGTVGGVMEADGPVRLVTIPPGDALDLILS
ncbi:MAG: hypothetical protein JWQ20_4298, partial [Conexibacter sp.]|nr:hypothetical protein [Conexibacter sp.]